MILIRHTTVLRIVKIKKNGAVMYVNQKKNKVIKIFGVIV